MSRCILGLDNGVRVHIELCVAVVCGDYWNRGVCKCITPSGNAPTVEPPFCEQSSFPSMSQI
jgi:hypothetical protein